MNAHVKELWVQALRSGEYKQGKATLKNNKKEYCCLGVLCDLFVQENPDKARWLQSRNGFSRIKIKSTQLAYADFLPPVVVEWAELDHYNPIDTNKINLSEYNDIHKKSFAEIADIIESDL